MRYLAKTPWILKQVYPYRIWQMDPREKSIYLTFDDGPHPTITPVVLAELKKYEALATFFCIGRNIVENPAVYKNIIEGGHAVGNHTYNHLDGFKHSTKAYLDDINGAAKHVDSNLFRPPYGRLRGSQAKKLLQPGNDYNIIMWSVLSGDFDSQISTSGCFQNVINSSGPGSIVVFHDSEKAAERMLFALPKTLEYFAEKGYLFRPIEMRTSLKKSGPG